jgi:hypothetical protein
VKLWTVQAHEVAAQLAAGTDYRADWARVDQMWAGAYAVMTAEMAARGIDCGGAPPVWAWPGWASPKQVRYDAEMLPSVFDWAHGMVMLRLAVPADQVLCTSYAAWNEFLDRVVNRPEPHDPMDYRGVLLSGYDCLQATIPQIKARWVRRAKPLPMPRHVRRQILRRPDYRHLLVPSESGGSSMNPP